MDARRHTLRSAALLSLGALAVHELRFLIAYGGGADAVLEREGHAYLTPLTPLLAVVLAGCLARLLARVAVGRAAGGEPPSLRRLWPAVAVALLGIYTAQELLEGALAAGHPVGLHGVLGGGGWTAAPLAALVAGPVALGIALLHERLAALALVSIAPWRWRAARPLRQRGGVRVRRAIDALLGRHLAGRAPPVPVV